MEMMLDKKQIQATFLFKFKMGHKAAETTCNINNAFGPGTANERTVQCWPKKFCEEMRALKMRNIVAGHWKLTTNLEALEADPLTVTQKVVDHSMVIWHLKQTGKVKKLDKWMPHELTAKKKKIYVLKCHLLIYATTSYFSIGL